MWVFDLRIFVLSVDVSILQRNFSELDCGYFTRIGWSDHFIPSRISHDWTSLLKLNNFWPFQLPIEYEVGNYFRRYLKDTLVFVFIQEHSDEEYNITINNN